MGFSRTLRILASGSIICVCSNYRKIYKTEVRGQKWFWMSGALDEYIVNMVNLFKKQTNQGYLQRVYCSCIPWNCRVRCYCHWFSYLKMLSRTLVINIFCAIFRHIGFVFMIFALGIKIAAEILHIMFL